MSDTTAPPPGRRILVTGGASGIGAAAVTVLDRGRGGRRRHLSPEHLRRMICRPPGCNATCATPTPSRRWCNRPSSSLGGLDVLVNAAGLWQAGIPEYVSADEISFLLDTNVKATILTNQAAYAVMKDQDPKGGRIINFGSSEALMGSPISAVYAATKGAVQAWTRSAARAWAADNVTVNALAPAVQTAGAERLREFLGPDAGALIDQQMKMMIPLGGALGDPAR